MLALLLLAAPVAAAPAAPPPQADVAPTQKGTVGVTFYLLPALLSPSAVAGGGDPMLVGLTYFLTPDTAARVDFGLNVPLTPSGAGQNVNFSVGLGLRFYEARHGPVALYVQPSVALGRETSPAISSGAAEFFRLGAGVGVEYYFTPHFSAAGTLELALKIANIAGPAANNSVYTTLGTGTSALSANFYF